MVVADRVGGRGQLCDARHQVGAERDVGAHERRVDVARGVGRRQHPVGQGDHADVVQPGPDDAAGDGGLVQSGLPGDRAGHLGDALDVGGRMALADAGDQCDRARDVLRRTVGHEAEVGVVGHLSDIGALPRRLERQAGTAAAISRSPPTTTRPSTGPSSASTACSGCGIRPHTLPASFVTHGDRPRRRSGSSA